MVNMRRDMSQHSGESWVTKPVYQLGIDLGTAFTRTAVFRNGVEIVPHEGQSMMPSCVAFTARYRPSMLPCHAFTERSRLVGLAASLQADINPSNTIFGVLRFIGQKYSDPKIQQIAKKSPFPIVDHNGGPAFVIDRHSPDEWNVTPVEIVALILCKARTDAQTYLGTEQCTNGAVITVPVSFTFPQRQAIRDAALVAGFTETRVISTPITICADYLITKPPNNFKNVLVVDLGAGYLDIAIVGIADGKIELKATDGDQNLGGEFVNDHLVRLPSKDTKYPHHQLSSLRTLCEKAKCNLSSHQQVLIRTSSWDGPDVTYAISREELFDCCKIIVSKLAKRIISVVLEAGLKSSDIDIAIITGGTSRILSIQRTLERLLDKLEIWMNPRSDEAASSGAAYLASVLFSKNTTGGFLVDAVPASINIHIADVYTFNVFRKNAAIPSNNKLMLTETGDTRGSRLVGLYEGEKTPVGNNTLIGMLPVPKPATKAVSQTEMWMEYTVDGKIIFGTGIDFLAIHDNQRARTPQRIVLNDLIGLPEQERTSMGERTSVFEFHEKLRLVKIETETYIMSLLDRLSLHLSTDAPYLQSRIWAIADRSLAWLCGHSFQATYMNYRSQKDRLESLEAELVSRFPNLAYLRPGEIDTSLRRVSNITRPLASRPYLMLPNPVPLVPPEPEVDIESEMPIAQIRDNTEDKSLRVSVSNSWPFKDPYDGETIRGPKDQHIHSTQKSKDLVVTQVHAKTPSSHQSMLQGAGAFKSVPVSASPPSASISTICQKLSARADKPQPTDIGITSIFTRKSAESSVITDTELLQISTYLRNTGQHVLSTIPRLYAVLRLLNQLEMIAIFIEQEMTDIWFPFSLASLPSTLSPTTRARFLEQQAIVLSKSLLFETNPERKHAHFAQDDSLPFQVVAKLGSGTHGQVDKVMSTVSHREYARKQFRRRRGTSKDAIKSFFVELQVLKRVQHAHCIELVHSYTDPKYFVLLMSPVADCDLSAYYALARDSRDKLSLLRSFFGCLANALRYIHSVKIRHRDIKPQNILVKGERVFLTDFGIALDWEHLTRSTTTADSGKTHIYAAPEVAYYEKRNSSADVWSLGCVFMEMTTVLKGETIASMRSFLQTRTGNYRFYANIDNLGHWAKTLRPRGTEKDNTIFGWVRAMLDKDAEERPTAAELYDDVLKESRNLKIPFCGSCCVEEYDSSGVEDTDEEDLWERAAELTVVPEES